MDEQLPNTGQSGTIDRDMGKRFLLVVGLVLELIMVTAGLWPAIWLILRFGVGSSSVAAWVLVILAAVLAFNYGYLLALLAFRIIIPYPTPGLYQLGPDGRPPLVMLVFLLNTLLSKTRFDPPWAAMFSSVLTRIWPLGPLFRKYFGPRTSSTTLGDTVKLLDPYLVEAGRNVQFGFDCTIACHHFDHRGFYLAKVKIGDNAVIGGQALLCAGVEVGPHAVIAARSFVLPDTKIGAHEYWGGSPARRIRDSTLTGTSGTRPPDRPDSAPRSP